MAIPTITSVTPSTLVSTTRAQVIITGTNFNLWPGIPFANAGVAVMFVFDGEEFLADHIGVISDTEIRCTAFHYMGDHKASPYTGDVRVYNLQADGSPVPGEVATLVDAVTYKPDDHLPGDGAQWGFTVRVLREYLRLLKITLRDIPIGIATHTDYHPEGVIVHFDIDLPALGIADIGADIQPHTPYDPDRDRTEGEEEEYLPTQYLWLRMSLLPLSENADETLSLTETVMRFGQRVRQVHVRKGPGSTDRLTLRHYLDPAPEFVFNAGVGTSQAAFTVRLGPVPIETPEITDRLFPLEEALVHAWANVDLTGPERETTILEP